MTKILNNKILILLTLLISVGMFSQQQDNNPPREDRNEIYISLAGGPSKIMYNLTTGKNGFDLGAGLGFGYKRFFTEHIGLSLGVEAAMYNGVFNSPGILYRGKPYDHIFGEIEYKADVSKYKENHRLYSFNVPIMVHFQSSGKHRFYTALGGKIGLPLSFSSTQSPIDKIHAVGHGELYNTNFDDLEIEGYGKFSRDEGMLKHTTDEMGLKTKVFAMLSAEVGMKWSLTEKHSLYTGAFVDYGITSITNVMAHEKERDFVPYYGADALDIDDTSSKIAVNSVLNSRYDYTYSDKGIKFIKDDILRPFICGIKLSLSFNVGGRTAVVEQEPIVEPEQIVEEVCNQSIHGLVYDIKTSQILANANMILYDTNSNKVAEIRTDAEGKYSYRDLECGSQYRINVSMEGYNSVEFVVNLPSENGTTKKDFGLDKSRIEVKKGDDLFKVLKLQPIYFDFDKSNIRPDAALELTKIVEVLREYPNMKIDVRSHTDSRGNDAYNLKLSDRRAKSTVNWIINQGIDKSRVQGRGYGETQLINRCANGVKCSAEKHQENRRSEFIVLEL